MKCTSQRHEPLLKHQDHTVVVRPSHKLEGQCYYYCTHCQVHVAWLSKQDSQLAEKLGIVEQTKGGIYA